MNTIKFRRVINKKAAAKYAAVAYVIMSAAYGTQAMYRDGTRAATLALNEFAASRVASQGLGAVTVREVPVIDAKAASEVVSAAAKEGAKAGADASIQSHLSGK